MIRCAVCVSLKFGECNNVNMQISLECHLFLSVISSFLFCQLKIRVHIFFLNYIKLWCHITKYCQNRNNMMLHSLCSIILSHQRFVFCWINDFNCYQHFCSMQSLNSFLLVKSCDAWGATSWLVTSWAQLELVTSWLV